MEEEKFKKMITAITLALNNYLVIAKQSGKIIIAVDAVNGDPIRCVVTNSLEVKLS